MTKKRPDALPRRCLSLSEALYEAEIQRLSRHLPTAHPRRAYCGANDNDPRYLILDAELAKTHPWLATQQARLVVVACSHRFTTGRVSGEDGLVENQLGDCASECMCQGRPAGGRCSRVGSARERG